MPLTPSLGANATAAPPATSESDAQQTQRFAVRLAATCVAITGVLWFLVNAQFPADAAQAALLLNTLITVMVAGFGWSLWRRAQRQAQLLVALESSRAEAHAANELKSRFVASVSHELRTPLNGILGYAELIRDTSEDAQSQEFAQIILHSAKHLQVLVDTILDLAKLESGKLVAMVQPLEPRALLADAASLNDAHARSQGLTLSLDVASDCPAVIESDRSRLLQIVNNLLNNAIKFTPQGSVTLRGERRGGNLAIVVTDTGIGIPEHLKPRIFTRFHAVGEQFIHPAQGAGLGLPLCKELADLLGATLTIESAEGRGTEATLLVPLKGNAR